jgi:hypothetical protein
MDQYRNILCVRGTRHDFCVNPEYICCIYELLPDFGHKNSMSKVN